MIDVELPDTPFTTHDLEVIGITREQLRRLVEAKLVRRLVRGAYLKAGIELTLETRARTVAAVISPHHVVTDRTAAWIHGVETLTYAEQDIPPPIDVCALRGHEPCSRDGVNGRSRDLAAQDVLVIEGLPVTTPLRTALDLGCLLRRREAMAALDAFARIHHLTKEQMAFESRRYRRRRGVIQMRELIALVDARAESARESWTRLAIHDAGILAPEPQVWIEIDGVPTYRLDLAYRYARVAVEYNGWDTHERTPEQRAHDRARRKWLCDNGWTVIVVRRGDFSGNALERWLGELRAALRTTYTNVRRMERGSRSTALQLTTRPTTTGDSTHHKPRLNGRGGPSARRP
jgi:very-short-patch-repair endonuclease